LRVCFGEGHFNLGTFIGCVQAARGKVSSSSGR
jgi:hypothetical protein